MSDAWPTELRLTEHGRNLKVSFENGGQFDIPAELLRVESPSAEVKGHGPGQEQLVFGKRFVSVTKIEPVGTYAVRLFFSDGHSTGIFTWPYLEKLGAERETLWSSYLAQLVAAGRSREP